jgi:hypothetical protein
MREGRFRLEAGVILWLISLSFWAGFALHRMEANAANIQRNQTIRSKIWDQLRSIDHRLSVIEGKLAR